MRKPLDLSQGLRCLIHLQIQKNPEILKAYQVGITAGASATTFEPNKLINREQVATMLSRAIRIMVPTADFSTDGAPTFKDEKKYLYLGFRAC